MIVRAILLFVLFWIIARLFWRFVDGVVKGAVGPGATRGQRGGVQTGVKMAPCPVCGTYVVPGKAISQAGSNGVIYFCSAKCRTEYVPR